MNAAALRDLAARETDVVARLERHFGQLIVVCGAQVDAEGMPAGSVARAAEEAKIKLAMEMAFTLIVDATKERIRLRRQMDAPGLQQPATRRPQ